LHIAEPRVGAAQETIGRSLGRVLDIDALPAGEKLQVFGGIELNVAAGAGRRVGGRAIRREDVVHEIQLLVGHELAAVEIEEGVLANRHREHLAGQRVGVGDLRILVLVVGQLGAQRARPAADGDLAATAAFAVVKELEGAGTEGLAGENIPVQRRPEQALPGRADIVRADPALPVAEAERPGEAMLVFHARLEAGVVVGDLLEHRRLCPGAAQGVVDQADLGRGIGGGRLACG